MAAVARDRQHAALLLLDRGRPQPIECLLVDAALADATMRRSQSASSSRARGTSVNGRLIRLRRADNALVYDLYNGVLARNALGAARGIPELVGRYARLARASWPSHGHLWLIASAAIVASTSCSGVEDRASTGQSVTPSRAPAVLPPIAPPPDFDRDAACASTGSACFAGTLEASPITTAEVAKLVQDFGVQPRPETIQCRGLRSAGPRGKPPSFRCSGEGSAGNAAVAFRLRGRSIDGKVHTEVSLRRIP